MENENTDTYLFEIGEEVRYEHRSKSGKCIIADRKRHKEYFLSDVHGVDIFVNVYTTKETYYIDERKVERFWEDPEMLLVSFDIEAPLDAVDYESDEFSADFLDSSGKVIKTVKSGKIGYAHEIVSTIIRGIAKQVN